MAITRTKTAPLTGVRHFKLEASNHSGAVRFLSGLHVNLEEGKTTSWVTVTRTGKFSDPRYGQFDITRDMLLSMVGNFDSRAYGQDIFIDVSHRPDNGAAGKVVKLTVEGDRLRALVEWTPYGVDAIKNKGYAYLSAEFHENWQDNEAGHKHGPVLLGAGLTVRPVIKRLDPVQLSEAVGDTPTYLHPELQSTLLQDIHQMKTKKLAALRAKLEALKLAGVNVDSLVRAYEKALAESTDEA
ncbi:MAG: phage protease, partial [Betaproteobacteria bacterium]|nr:phage protease [Betaproteobacteria bacterium]